MNTSVGAIGLGGALLVAAVVTFGVMTAQGYPPDLSRGKAVYEHHCQSCHGPNGYGDGPAGESLKVKPTDFHRFRSLLKSDEEYLRTIEHGVVFSPMHSWRGQLTDDEMTDVVAYIRLFLREHS
ncbi:MAG TPA: cytochrome c [Nitrospira sp.]